MPDPNAQPAQTRTVYLPNYGLSVSFPADYTDKQIDAAVRRNRDTLRANSPAVQKANAALSNAAVGVGLPTMQRGTLTVLPPAIIQQGIPQTPQAQQMQHNVDLSEEWQTLVIVLSLTLLCFLGYLAARRRLHRWIAQRKSTLSMIPSRNRVVAVALIAAALMTLFPPFDGYHTYYGCLLIAQEGSLDMGRLQMQYIILGLITGAVILLSADRAKRT